MFLELACSIYGRIEQAFGVSAFARFARRCFAALVGVVAFAGVHRAGFVLFAVGFAFGRRRAFGLVATRLARCFARIGFCARFGIGFAGRFGATLLGGLGHNIRAVTLGLRRFLLETAVRFARGIGLWFFAARFRRVVPIDRGVERAGLSVLT